MSLFPTERRLDERAERERTFLQELDEDDYDALDDEARRRVDEQQLILKRQRLNAERAKKVCCGYLIRERIVL